MAEALTATNELIEQAVAAAASVTPQTTNVAAEAVQASSRALARELASKGYLLTKKAVGYGIPLVGGAMEISNFVDLSQDTWQSIKNGEDISNITANLGATGLAVGGYGLTVPAVANAVVPQVARLAGAAMPAVAPAAAPATGATGTAVAGATGLGLATSIAWMGAVFGVQQAAREAYVLAYGHKHGVAHSYTGEMVNASIDAHEARSETLQKDGALFAALTEKDKPDLQAIATAIAHGADVNAHNHTQTTSTTVSVSGPYASSSTHTPSDHLNTPLHYAVLNASPDKVGEIVHYLATYAHADVNAPNARYATPLMLGIEQGRVEAVAALLKIDDVIVDAKLAGDALKKLAEQNPEAASAITTLMANRRTQNEQRDQNLAMLGYAVSDADVPAATVAETLASMPDSQAVLAARQAVAIAEETNRPINVQALLKELVRHGITADEIATVMAGTGTASEKFVKQDIVPTAAGQTFAAHQASVADAPGAHNAAAPASPAVTSPKPVQGIQ